MKAELATREEIQHSIRLIESFRQELDSIKDVASLKTIADKAEALKIWAKRAKISWHIGFQAGEVRVRAARRGGQILSSMPKGYGRAGESEYSKTCENAGIAQWQGAIWQRLSDLTEEQFEASIEDAKDHKSPPSMRKIIRGNIDKPKDGCTITLHLDESAKRKLQKWSKHLGLTRDQAASHILTSALRNTEVPKKE